MRNRLISLLLRILPLGLAAAMVGCQAATPLKGPGVGSGRRILPHDGGSTVYIGVTNAVLDGDKRGDFDDHTRRVIKSLPATSGYVGHSVRTRFFGNEVWTMTIWKDEAALDAFVHDSTHSEAMRRGMGAVVSAKFDRFSWPTNEPAPTWSHILTRLESVQPRTYGARPTN